MTWRQADTIFTKVIWVILAHKAAVVFYFCVSCRALSILAVITWLAYTILSKRGDICGATQAQIGVVTFAKFLFVALGHTRPGLCTHLSLPQHPVAVSYQLASCGKLQLLLIFIIRFPLSLANSFLPA